MASVRQKRPRVPQGLLLGRHGQPEHAGQERLPRTP